MNNQKDTRVTKLSVIIPCFNEESTLKRCVERVMDISDETLSLEIIIVDDASTDKSLAVGRDLERKHQAISVFHLDRNQGKGAPISFCLLWR